MKRNHLIPVLILAEFLLLLTLFSCGETDYTASDSREIEAHEEVIIFFGDTETDVTFNHKDHSDRYNGDCFECHNCGDFSKVTYWRCQECHSSDDPESLCEGEADGHGCIMVQCQTCHEKNYEYKDCVDCHP